MASEKGQRQWRKEKQPEVTSWAQLANQGGSRECLFTDWPRRAADDPLPLPTTPLHLRGHDT